MRRLWALAGALLGLCWLAPLSAATTVAPLTLAEQARKAQVIVRATLGKSEMVKAGDVVYQVYPLDVAEVIAGDPASLPQHQGKPALFFLNGVTGLPTLSTKQEGFALLYTGRLDSPLVGFNQGWYALREGKVDVTMADKKVSDPAALREALRQARGAK